MLIAAQWHSVVYKLGYFYVQKVAYDQQWDFAV